MEITSTEAQNNFGRYIKLARFEDIIVTKSGKKVVVIKPYEEKVGDGSNIAEKAEVYGMEDMKISYEDFLKLSEESEKRYEYIDGEVYLLASPSYNHQTIIVEILTKMYNWFKDKKCRPLTSPFDITLLKDDNKNVVQPDIVVICDTENVNERGRYLGVPSLVVEVLSQLTKNKDMLKKLNLYIHSGVGEYWIVNPFNREVYVYYFKEKQIEDYKVYKEKEILKSPTFEGLQIYLEQVFE